MFKYALCTALLAQQLPSFALMPPLWEDAAQLKAILEDERLGEYLPSGAAILEINRTTAGWEVLTNHGQVVIDVLHHSQPMPGRGHFELNFKR